MCASPMGIACNVPRATSYNWLVGGDAAKQSVKLTQQREVIAVVGREDKA